MQALGPTGPGLLCVTCVPRGAAELRCQLLPLGRRLALLPQDQRSSLLKEHGLGSDVPLKSPDRSVSSFAMKLKYTEQMGREIPAGCLEHKEDNDHVVSGNPTIQVQQEVSYCEFNRIGDTFKELGLWMMELGLRLAQICDKAVGGSVIQESILESCTAKGRLIHYHSLLEKFILKDPKKGTKRYSRKVDCPLSCCSTALSNSNILQEFGIRSLDDSSLLEQYQKNNKGNKLCHVSLHNLWQQWHYDYGIFTVLTTPLFISSCQETRQHHLSCNKFSSFDGHTHLHLYEPYKKKILAVRCPLESFIIQVGESADILSGGKLRSTLHAVSRPLDTENISRETFVVFLQPSWDRILPSSRYNIESNDENVSTVNEKCSVSTSSDTSLSSTAVVSEGSHQLLEEILGKIPPLSSRLREGMTFANFARETTKQYYGGSGTQPRK